MVTQVFNLYESDEYLQFISRSGFKFHRKHKEDQGMDPFLPFIRVEQVMETKSYTVRHKGEKWLKIVPVYVTEPSFDSPLSNKEIMAISRSHSVKVCLTDPIRPLCNLQRGLADRWDAIKEFLTKHQTHLIDHYYGRINKCELENILKGG
jgi:hypothetical protein